MERAIDRMRDLAVAYFELGRLYLALYLDEEQTARQHVTPAGREGQFRIARDRLEQAEIAFAEARRLKDDLPAWQVGYVDAVRRLAHGDFAGCAAACDDILAVDADLEEVWKLKGDALRRLGEDPLPAYARAVDTRRSYHEALLAIAEVHLEACRLTEARETLAHALETHSGLVAAEVLWARSFLIEAQAGGAKETVRLGLERATALCERNREHRGAAITLAELEIEMGRSSGDASWVDRAIDRLERAPRFRGCETHVELLQGRARLERARLLRSVDPAAARADLEAVLSRRDSAGDAWAALVAEAERELAAL
jgi:hypothetical protein